MRRLCLCFQTTISRPAAPVIIEKDVVILVKKYGDIIASVFFLIFAAFYFAGSFSIEIMDRYGGAALIPRICAGVIAACALILLYRAVFGQDKAPAKPAKKPEEGGGDESVEGQPSNYRLVALTVLAIALYAALFNVLGFLVTTFLYLICQILMLMPGRNLRAVIVAAVTAAIVAFLVYMLFYNVFYVMLPSGTLWAKW